MLTLSSLMPGECGIVKSVDGEFEISRRILDLGVVPGTKIQCVNISPLGDPKAFFVRGTLIALRCDDSSNIILE